MIDALAALSHGRVTAGSVYALPMGPIMNYRFLLICVLSALVWPQAASAQVGARITHPMYMFSSPGPDAAQIGSIGPRPGCIVEKPVTKIYVQDTATYYLIRVATMDGWITAWVNAAAVSTQPVYHQPVCGRLTGDVVLGGTQSARQLQALVQAKLSVLSERIRRPLHLNAGYRSRAEQAVLYAAFLAGHGAPADPPGKSRHQRGLAADVEIGTPRQAKDQNLSVGNNRRAKRVARQVGLTFPHGNEPWHVELPS